MRSGELLSGVGTREGRLRAGCSTTEGWHLPTRSRGCQGQATPGSLSSTLGGQVSARWALDCHEGPSPAVSLPHPLPLPPAQKPFHRQAGWECWLPLSPTPPSCLGPHADPPLWAPQQAQVGERPAWSTMWLLVPQPGRASWNWPISCLGHGAFSKVNKQIQRSWGLGWKAGCWGFLSPHSNPIATVAV